MRLPIGRVLLDGAREAPQPRVLGRVIRLQVPHGVGFRYRATAFNELIRNFTQTLKPLGGHHVLHKTYPFSKYDSR